MSSSKFTTKLFSVQIPLAKWKTKKTEQICSLNNTGRWIKFGITKIKNEYKDILRDFYIPDAEHTYDTCLITYKILRHNKRKVDADGITPWSGKWFQDSLVDTNHLSDDDKVYYAVAPAEYTENLIETQLEVTVFVEPRI